MERKECNWEREALGGHEEGSQVFSETAVSPHSNAVYSWKPRTTSVLNTVKSYCLPIRLSFMKIIK